MAHKFLVKVRYIPQIFLHVYCREKVGNIQGEKTTREIEVRE